MDLLHFDGANILVTGGSRGLGLAFVKALSVRDINQVYAGCRTDEGCDFVKSFNLPNVTPILLDITNDTDIHNISIIISKLDIVINNAGIASACHYTSKEALSTSKAEMAVHYFGTMSIIQQVMSLLKASQKAGIINISSIAGLSNYKAMGTYSASKSALHFLTQGLRAELSEDNVFVQGVYPGPFDTRLAAGYDGPKQAAETLAEFILNAYNDRQHEVFPDDFSNSMHQIFLESPKKLENIFSE